MSLSGRESVEQLAGGSGQTDVGLRCTVVEVRSCLREGKAAVDQHSERIAHHGEICDGTERRAEWGVGKNRGEVGKSCVGVEQREQALDDVVERTTKAGVQQDRPGDRLWGRGQRNPEPSRDLGRIESPLEKMHLFRDTAVSVEVKGDGGTKSAGHGPSKIALEHGQGRAGVAAGLEVESDVAQVCREDPEGFTSLVCARPTP